MTLTCTVQYRPALLHFTVLSESTESLAGKPQQNGNLYPLQALGIQAKCPWQFVSRTRVACFLRLQLSPLRPTVPWLLSGQWHCLWGEGAVLPGSECAAWARQQHRASLTVYPVMVLACCFGIFHCTLNAVQFSESSRISRGGPSLSAKNKMALCEDP